MHPPPDPDPAAEPGPSPAGSGLGERLFALSLLSGVCGIAYELLYARLLTTYLGDMFYVSAGILGVFLLGMAAGAGLSSRLQRWLWAIEGAIGLCALVAAGVTTALGGELLVHVTPLTAGRPAMVIAVVMAALAVPAMLVGCSVPLFAQRMRAVAARQGRFANFHLAYLPYNLGAGLAVIGMEYAVLRSLGVTWTLVAVAGLNVLIALALVSDGRLRAPVEEPTAGAPVATPPPAGASDGAGLAALTLASAASGVFQLFVLKLAETFLGPYHENFALVLALGLFGIAAGSAAVARWPGTFAGWLRGGAIATALALATVGVWVSGWGYLHGLVGVALDLPVAAKAALLAAIAGPGYVAFGATVPALLASRPGLDPGRVLAVSSVGNCLGYLATALWLHAALSSLGVAVVVVLGLTLASALVTPLALVRRSLPALLAALALLAVAWPEGLLGYSYRDLRSPTALRKAQAAHKAVQVSKRFDSHVALIEAADGTRTLHINGYRSLVVRGDGTPNLHELLYGITPAVFARQHQRALVLGLGTGLTAAGTAPLFAATKVVEIDPAILDLVETFASANFGLLQMPGVEVVLEDGLAALAGADRRYDAIINTVTTPLYFASSKLYAREFLELARQRLAPGGVYAAWLDARVTGEGARSIFATVAGVFPHCAVVMLKTGYLQLICSNEPLTATAAPLQRVPPAMRAVLERGAGGQALEAIVRAVTFVDHNLHRRRWDAPLHTFDYPFLEFVMASATLDDGKEEPFAATLALDFARGVLTASADGALSADEVLERCLVLAAIATGVPAGCSDRLAALHGGKVPARYHRRLVDLAIAGAIPPKGDVAGWALGLAMTCLDIGDRPCAEAIAARMEGNAPTLPAHDRLAALQGASSIRAAIAVRSGAALTPALATEAFRHAPFAPSLRRMLALDALRRGARDVGIAHLQALSRGAALLPSDHVMHRRLLALPAAATEVAP